MAKGIALLIGLDSVDPDHYSGWIGKLNSCENDVKETAKITESQGFETKLLLTTEATRENVIGNILEIAQMLNPGDIFYLCYSGHGGQKPDRNNDEADGMDETWCLYDGQIIDDELSNLWAAFQGGVRVFITSDSCHSGTVSKEMNNNSGEYTKKETKDMPNEYAFATYMEHKSFYDKISRNVQEVKSENINASVILISGCQDNQVSMAGTFCSAFTKALKFAWHGGTFIGSHEKFKKTIAGYLPPTQSPNLTQIGQPNPNFLNQIPFTI